MLILPIDKIHNIYIVKVKPEIVWFRGPAKLSQTFVIEGMTEERRGRERERVLEIIVLVDISAKS
jgi:hypothetical protein